MTMLLEMPAREELPAEPLPTQSLPPFVSFSVRDLCITLIAVTAVVYWNSFAGQFVFDDILQITDNPNIRQLWPLADWQRPLGYFTFQVNYAFSGLQPWGYHLLNLLIHLVNGLLLFDLTRRCIQRVAVDERLRARSNYLAFAVALMWLVHPLTTTAVTYTVQRLESLMALCFLICLYALLRSADSPQPRRWQVAAVAAMLLGVLTKEVMITCLPVAILFDRAFVARSWQGVRERCGFYCCLTLPLAWTFFTMRVTNAEEYAAGFGFRGVTPWEYLRSQPQVLLHYLRLSFWPDELLLDYGWSVVNDPRSIYLPGLVIVGLVGLSLFALWRWPPIGCVALSAFLVLGPSSSIMPIADLCFEHRFYLPLMSVIALTVLAVDRLIAARVERTHRATVATGCLLLIVAALGYRTMHRNADYADPIRLWEKNVAARPAHARPHLLLAMLYDRAGRTAEAGVEYHAAVAVKPSYFKGLLNLGGWHFRQGEFSLAADCFGRALEVEPSNPAGYVQRGRALLELGDAAAAMPLLETGLQIEPSNSVALRALGWLLSTANEHELRDGPRALQLLQQLPSDPQQQDVWRLDVLAAACAETGNYSAALEMIGIACRRAAEQNRSAALQEQLRERARCYQRGEAWRLGSPKQQGRG